MARPLGRFLPWGNTHREAPVGPRAPSPFPKPGGCSHSRAIPGFPACRLPAVSAGELWGGPQLLQVPTTLRQAMPVTARTRGPARPHACPLTAQKLEAVGRFRAAAAAGGTEPLQLPHLLMPKQLSSPTTFHGKYAPGQHAPCPIKTSVGTTALCPAELVTVACR